MVRRSSLPSSAMRLLLVALTVTVLAACSDDDEPDIADATESEWLDQWDDGRFDRTQEHDGQRVGVSEDEEMIYTQDCDLAEELTSEDGPYGPTDEPGYAYICE